MTDQTPTLRTRALAALATNRAEEAKEAEEQIASERTTRHLTLLDTLERVLGVGSAATAEIDPDYHYAIVDGIYFEVNSYARLDHNTLNVYIDQQNGEGAVPFSVDNLILLGTLIEEFGDGNMVDLRDYVPMWHGLDDKAVQRFMPKTEVERLLASGDTWSRDE